MKISQNKTVLTWLLTEAFNIQNISSFLNKN